LSKTGVSGSQRGIVCRYAVHSFSKYPLLPFAYFAVNRFGIPLRTFPPRRQSDWGRELGRGGCPISDFSFLLSKFQL
jgi:hypothetical protein